MSNVESIGRVLYTDYVYIFQAAGIVLLIAMIGAIVLTLRHKPNIKRQNVARQVGRDAKTAMEVKSVETGAGISSEDLL
ncbi:NADH-quinone oxidoreductase subunit J [Brevundimonas sp. Root1423]